MWKNINRCLPPLGLAYIAAFLEKQGQAVEIVDVAAARLTLEETVARVREKNPAYVGLGASTVLIDTALQIARAVRAALPAAKIVLGGVHPTIFPDAVLAHDFVDYVVRGEGELTMSELVQGRAAESILGLSYKKNGLPAHNADRPFIENIDTLPAPAFHLLPMERYRPSTGNYKRLPAASLVTARGCPGRCTFCYTGASGRRIRFHSAAYIVETIERLVKDYGIKEVSFYDDTFTAFKANVEQFCRLLQERKIDITWSCMSRVDMVDYGILKLMRSCGCHQVGYGIESSSEEILKNINKSTSLERVRQAVKDTRRSGIDVRGDVHVR